MKKFQYQIVRYIPDRVTGEFVNVGIIVFQPESNFLKGKFLSKYSRVTQFFTEINGQHLVNSLKHFNKKLDGANKKFSELFTNYKEITEITDSILPKDDSALICSDVLQAIDLSPSLALNDLFDRLVTRHIQEGYKDQKDDRYVWKKIYKKFFDKYEITEKLQPFSMKTKNDEIEFDNAWKNGIWNCFQPVSFDLKRTDAVKNKVYKWSGIINELENANKELNLYFLTTTSTKNKQLKHFIEDTLTNRKQNLIKVMLVTENEADNFVKSIKDEIELHGRS